MDNNAKISIIVPIYNTVDYLERCLNSIINQTHKNLEIICIDDGSTDGSGELLDKIAATDNRIIAIHIPNGGVSNARNTGLERATGEFVGFVDSDDYIELDMYEILFNNISNANADLAICNSQYYHNDILLKKESSNVLMMHTVEEAIKNILISNYYSGHTWNKLFKKNCMGNVRFNKDIKIREDLLYVIEFLLNCNSIVYNSKPLYNYYIHAGSAMKSPFDENYINSFHIHKVFHEKLYGKFKDIEKYIVANSLKFALLLLIKIEDSKYKDNNGHINEMIYYIKKNLNFEALKFINGFKGKIYLISIKINLFWLLLKFRALIKRTK